MGSAIGQTLGNAVGVAISPIPVIALTLMLFSASAARNSVMFVAGWLVGLTSAGAVILAIGFESSDGEADSGGVLKLVIGVALLGLAAKQWRGRPRPGEEPTVPNWMSAIAEFSGAKAFGTGVALSAANPKNVGLTMAAAATISGAGLDTGEQAASLAVFVLIASTTVILPVVGYLAASERVTPLLDSLRDWLTANNAAVMTVLFVVLGAKVLGDGIAVLA